MDSDHNPELKSEQPRGTIFFCDVTVEASRLMMKLRLLGYHVLDVPLSTLASRTAFEPPALVICDADSQDVVSEIDAAHRAASREFGLLLLCQPESDLTHLAFLGDHEILSRPVEMGRFEKLVRKLAGPPATLTDVVDSRQSSKTRRSSLLASAFRRASSVPALQIREQPVLRKDSNPAESGEKNAPALPEQRFVYQSIFPVDEKTDQDQTRFSQGTNDLLAQARAKIAEHPLQPPRPERLGQDIVGGHIEQRFIDALREPLEAELDPAEQTGTADNARSRESDQRTSAGGKRISDIPLDSEVPGTNNSPSTQWLSLDSQREHPELLQPPLIAPEMDDSSLTGVPTSHLAPHQRPTTAPRPPHLEENNSEFIGRESRRLSSDLDLKNRGETSAFEHHEDGQAVASERELISTTPPQRGVENALKHLSAIQTDLDDPDSFFATTSNPQKNHAAREPVPEASSEPYLDRRTPHDEEQFKAGQSAEVTSLLSLMIRLRMSGSIAEEVVGGIRRVLFRDGDILTLHSSAPDESLVEFLRTSGIIQNETAQALGRIPTAGRYAGAALVARGVLSQEDLWATLRAHAEWLLGRMISNGNSATYEESSPQQLAEEPAVFGGSAGSEIFVEAIKRVLSPETCYQRLGGSERTLGRGSYELLRGETALPESELNAMRNCLGKNLSSVFQTQPTLLIVIYALTELGIFSTGTPQLGFSQKGSPINQQALNQETRPNQLGETANSDSHEAQDMSDFEFQRASRQLDLAAFRARLESRLQFVKDGNYFQILGIAPSSTTYEVQRAATQLRSEFSEADRSLEQIEIAKKIQLLLDGISEAELVLRDEVRRRRYRIAIGANP